MFSLEQVAWIIRDIFSTELVKNRKDTFAFFDTQEDLNLADMPPTVRTQAAKQVGIFFGFEPAPFTSLGELAIQSAAAYKKNQFVYLSTSGSTGAPKQICHTQTMMQQEGQSVGRHFSSAKRLITLTPCQHLYGLSFAVFFPSVYHIPAFALPPLPVQPWAHLLQAGDVLAGFPLFWEYFLKASNRLPPGVTAVTSTAPCPSGLFDRLKQAGAARVVELYGATDTGGIGVREDENAPFEINDFWEISADHSRIRREGLDGWLPFPDEVRFVPPRGIYPLKRTDCMVQVAGVNVSPQHVERVLAEYPAVQACRVRLMRPDEGKRLKAFIVLKPGFSADVLPKLRAFLTARLSSHEMPRAFTFGNRLPTNAMGKASDW